MTSDSRRTRRFRGVYADGADTLRRMCEESEEEEQKADEC